MQINANDSVDKVVNAINYNIAMTTMNKSILFHPDVQFVTNYTSFCVRSGKQFLHKSSNT
jgi:hypothetical protein